MTDALDYDALDFFRGTETVADPSRTSTGYTTSVRCAASLPTACTW